MRKKKFTPEDRKRIAHLKREGKTTSEICLIMGCGRSTGYVSPVKQKEKAIKEELEKGTPVELIARRFRVGKSTIYRMKENQK